MKQSKAYLKERFSTGNTPTQQDYADWIDTYVHLDDQAAVDSQTVSTLLQQYDSNLKGLNVNGNIDTLGDVFAFLAGISDTTKLADSLAKINWTTLPGKPSFAALTWTEQFIVTDSTTYNPLASSGTAGSGPNQRWLVSGVGATNQALIVLDVKTERHWIVSGAGGESGFYVDQIIALKLAVQAKATL